MIKAIIWVENKFSSIIFSLWYKVKRIVHLQLVLIDFHSMKKTNNASQWGPTEGRTIPYYHIHDDNNDDNKNKTSWLYKSSSNSVPVRLMPISYRKRERRRSGAYAEQEQRAPIVLSYWQRSSRAAEPWLVLQYRQVSSFLSYSSKHCVPCALMRNLIKLNQIDCESHLNLNWQEVVCCHDFLIILLPVTCLCHTQIKNEWPFLQALQKIQQRKIESVYLPQQHISGSRILASAVLILIFNVSLSYSWNKINA